MNVEQWKKKFIGQLMISISGIFSLSDQDPTEVFGTKPTRGCCWGRPTVLMNPGLDRNSINLLAWTEIPSGWKNLKRNTKKKKYIINKKVIKWQYRLNKEKYFIAWMVNSTVFVSIYKERHLYQNNINHAFFKVKVNKMILKNRKLVRMVKILPA